MRLFRFSVIILAVLLLLGLATRMVDTAQVLPWAADRQREIQNAMAHGLRDVRQNSPFALLTLCGLTFAYGVIHAIGPGHGKVLLGSAGLANRARMRRLSALTLAAALGQSVTAIAMVLVGASLVAMTRSQLVSMTETQLAPLSYAAIALVGTWIAYRGARSLWRHLPAPDPQSALACGPDCGCGHRHAPTLAEVDAVMGPREMLVLVASIAMRPCTGAIFLMVIAWRMDILPAGILATLTMGLGTATFNVIVAGAGLGLHMFLARLGRNLAFALLAPALQLFAGGLIIMASGSMLLRVV